MNYQVEDYETGNIIEQFTTMAEAEAYCAKAEKQDKDDGNYTPGFYAIRNAVTDELTRYNY